MLLSCLKEMDAEFSVSGENAGVHLLLHFNEGISEKELIRQAEEEGVKVYGLSEYFVGRGTGEKKKKER